MKADLPPRCAGTCPLDAKDVNRLGIILTRNCDGPSYDKDVPVTSTVVVEKGEIVDVRLPVELELSQVACTNSGFSQWVSAKKAEYIRTKSSI